MFKSKNYLLVAVVLLCFVNLSLCQNSANDEDTNVTGEEVDWNVKKKQTKTAKVYR